MQGCVDAYWEAPSRSEICCAVVLGRGAFDLLGWAGPRGVYFAGCTDAVVGLGGGGASDSLSIPFTSFDFSCFGEDSACRRDRFRSEVCRAADCRVGH